MNAVTKYEFSSVLKIGQTVGKKELNLNALAWESPSNWTDKNGEEHSGFCPDDPFYDEIVKTFKSFPDVYRENFNGGTIVRKHWVGSDNYDILIKWYSEPKMISFYFCKSYEYSI